MANNNRICCIKCEREFSVSAFGVHVNAKTCVKGAIVIAGSIRKTDQINYPSDLKCPHCSKICQSIQSYHNHVRCCPHNKERQYKNGMTGKDAWNKGLTKETDERVKKIGEDLSARYKAGKIPKRVITEKGRQTLSSLAKLRGLGGPRPNKKRGMYYKGVWLDSSWELRVAQSLDTHNIQWVRPKNGFIWTNKGNRYYPDFYLPDYDVYLDPKNPYLTIKDSLKIKEAQRRNNIRVFVLSEEQLDWNSIRGLI